MSGKWSKSLVCIAGLFMFLLAACTSSQPVPTPTITDNGIPVAEAFAAFYEQNGGQRIFGEPITEGFTLDEDGRFIQYFQAMRLEYDRNSQAITIYPLGEWALAGLNNPVPAAVPANSLARTFPETQLTTQDEFLAFYEAHQGELLFGPPISPQLDEGELRVQYFRNGRLEWRPEFPMEQRVQVSYLGQAHFDAEMAFTYRQALLAQPVPFAGIERVDVFTSVKSTVLYAGDEQVVYVTVLTPAGRPVSGIAADVTITYGDNASVFNIGQTDAEGRIVAALPDLNIPPGQQVQLQTAVYGADDQVIGRSTLTFKTWW